MTSSKMDSCTSFSSLHGSGVVVPLSKTDAHPLEMLGSSNKNPALNIESASGAQISPSISPSRRGSSGSTNPPLRRRFHRRRSNSDGDRYMLMADQRQSVSERSLVSTTSSSMPRRKSLDAQCVADLKVQLAEQQAQTDQTALLIAQLNVDKDELEAARDKALEKCKQLECDITRQKQKYEDKISRLEARMEAQANELEKIRLERDEMVEVVEVASRRGSMVSAVSVSATGSGGGALPHVNRRNSLQAMHERRRSMQQRRSSNDTVGSGGRLTSGGSRRGSVTSHGSGRWSMSDHSLQNSATSVTSGMSRQGSVQRARASITESIGEVGASIRDLMSHARDAAGGTASASDLAHQDSLAPEDLLWMSDPSFHVDDSEGSDEDEDDFDVHH